MSSQVQQDDDLTMQLVRNIQKGISVERSSERLVSQLSPSIIRFFRRKSVPPALVEDLTQDTFLRLFSTINNFDAERGTPVYAWLVEIASHTFKNWLRSLKTKKREGLEVSLTGPPREDGLEPLDLPLVDERPDPFAQLAERGQEEALRAAISGLSDQRRRCCELRYIYSLKYKEIAAVMNISIETVKAHIHQAKAILEEAVRSPGPAREKPS